MSLHVEASSEFLCVALLVGIACSTVSWILPTRRLGARWNRIGR